MKKLYFILSIIISSSAFTQLSFPDGDSLYLSETSTDIYDIFDVKGHITNNGSTTTVTWTVDSIYNPNNWNLSLCDKETCLDADINTTNDFTLDLDETTNLKAGFKASGVAGYGYFRVKVENDDTTMSMSFHADIEVDIADGISSFEKNSITIFPNPVSSIINVDYSGEAEIKKVAFYNIIGKKIKEINNIGENNSINISDFNDGLYIVKLFGENEELFFTKSFVKK